MPSVTRSCTLLPASPTAPDKHDYASIRPGPGPRPSPPGRDDYAAHPATDSPRCDPVPPPLAPHLASGTRAHPTRQAGPQLRPDPSPRPSRSPNPAEPPNHTVLAAFVKE